MIDRDLLQRVLIVDDDLRLRALLGEFVADLGATEVRYCGSVSQCLDELRAFRPTLLLLDFKLSDGTGMEALRHHQVIATWPTTIVLSGGADATDAFEFGRLGAGGFVQKPVTLEGLRRAIEHAQPQSQDLVPLLRGIVGQASIQDVQQLVRGTMLTEAISQANGNRRAAARILRVSRQLVQHMLKSTGA